MSEDPRITEPRCKAIYEGQQCRRKKHTDRTADDLGPSIAAMFTMPTRPRTDQHYSDPWEATDDYHVRAWNDDTTGAEYLDQDLNRILPPDIPEATITALGPDDSVVVQLPETATPERAAAYAEAFHAHGIDALVIVGEQRMSSISRDDGRNPLGMMPAEFEHKYQTDPVFHHLIQIYEHEVGFALAARRAFRANLAAVWRLWRDGGPAQDGWATKMRRVMNDAYFDMVKHQESSDPDLAD